MNSSAALKAKKNITRFLNLKNTITSMLALTTKGTIDVDIKSLIQKGRK